MKLRPTFAPFVDTATFPRVLLFGVVIVAVGGGISASSLRRIGGHPDAGRRVRSEASVKGRMR